MAGIKLEPLAHDEAIQFFRSKGYAPQLQRFHHLDHFREEHARDWVVAKAVRDDVSRTIREAVDRQIGQGVPMTQAIRDLAPELQRLGWWGRSIQRDPVTGELVEVQLGSMRRLRTIFDTNMRTAHAAGHWASIQRTKAAFPYLHYIQIDRPTKRHEHARFHDRIWHVDDPIWLRIYPPNGWFCGCYVLQRTEGWMRRNGRTPDETLDLEELPWTNERTGEVMQVPRGVHPGFDANPGAIWLELEGGWGAMTPDLTPEERAAQRGVLQGLRVRRLGIGRETLAIVDEAGGLIDLRDAMPAAPATVDLTGMTIPPRAHLLHSHLSEAALSYEDILMLQQREARSITAVSPGGAIWRARAPERQMMAVREAYAPFRQHVVPDLWNEVQRLPGDEPGIVYWHAMMRWLEKNGLITYSWHAPGRIGEVLARHAPLIERLTDVRLPE